MFTLKNCFFHKKKTYKGCNELVNFKGGPKFEKKQILSHSKQQSILK